MIDMDKIRTEAKEYANQVAKKASKIQAYYVICFWMGPISNELSYRMGYFEDINEATNFIAHMKYTYTEQFDLPYYIVTNFGNSEDGGLFDEVR